MDMVGYLVVGTAIMVGLGPYALVTYSLLTLGFLAAVFAITKLPSSLRDR
jgi:hypothetical protein